MEAEEAIDEGTAFLLAAFDPANRRDPYPLYRAMRQEQAVLDGGNNLWFTFSHGAAHGLLRAKNVSSDERTSNEFKANLASGDPRYREFAEQEPLMLFMDPPDHTRLRGLVNMAFTARTVDALVGRITEVTDALLDVAVEQAADGPIDVVELLARPLPVAIICEMLGVPAADVDAFAGWSDDLTRGLDPGALRSEEDELVIDQARTDLIGYTGDLLAERRRSPGDDLISGLLAARDGDDRLTEDELINLVILLLVAGHETTVNLIGNGVVSLLTNPDQLTIWQSDPGLDKNAVDELLRYDSPVQIGMRVTVEPMTVGGVDIPRGDQVLTLLGAANRDPEVFDEPERLDLRRANAARHLSFGGGIHHCLGMALARVEGQIALGRLVRRFSALELAEPPEIRSRFVLRGFEAVHVAAG
ncbi:MAG: cytochrome P450 [Actinomycetota bacterium]